MLQQCPIVFEAWNGLIFSSVCCLSCYSSGWSPVKGLGLYSFLWCHRPINTIVTSLSWHFQCDMKWNVLLKHIGIQISVKFWTSHRRVDLNAAVFVERWIPEAWNTTSHPFRQMQDHSRDSQLDSYITVPDLLYVSAVESLKAPVFYKLRTWNVVLFRFLTWYMADL